MSTRLLICDDSNMARKQVARSLPDDWDVEISFAHDGVQGIEAIKAGKGDVLLLDLNMPNMDGYQVLEAILKQDLPTLVVVISGDIQPEAHNRVKGLGALDFIKKPVNKEKLTEILLAYGIFTREEKNNADPTDSNQDGQSLPKTTNNESDGITQTVTAKAPVKEQPSVKSSLPKMTKPAPIALDSETSIADDYYILTPDMRDCYQEIANVAKQVGFIPVVDMAYQGFGQDLDSDAFGLRLMADTVDQMIICSSCSKNFGLYRERIGACSIIGKDSISADIINSVLLQVVRVNYSMPPAHGAAIVETILSSAELTTQWHGELKEMRDRINGMRQLLVDQLVANGVTRDFSFITKQNGMFSFLGIDKEQVQRLQDEFSIYIVGSSRISLAGISPDNVNYLTQSIAKVL